MARGPIVWPDNYDPQKTVGSRGIPQIHREQHWICKEPNKNGEDPDGPLCAVHHGIHKVGMAKAEGQEESFCDEGPDVLGGAADCLRRTKKVVNTKGSLIRSCDVFLRKVSK